MEVKGCRKGLSSRRSCCRRTCAPGVGNGATSEEDLETFWIPHHSPLDSQRTSLQRLLLSFHRFALRTEQSSSLHIHNTRVPASERARVSVAAARARFDRVCWNPQPSACLCFGTRGASSQCHDPWEICCNILDAKKHAMQAREGCGAHLQCASRGGPTVHTYPAAASQAQSSPAAPSRTICAPPALRRAGGARVRRGGGSTVSPSSWAAAPPTPRMARPAAALTRTPR